MPGSEENNSHSHKFNTKNYIVPNRKNTKIIKLDPDDTTGFDGNKQQGKTLQKELTKRLEILQEKLYAEHKHKILIVLQAMDTGGKDGVIRHVFEGVNPQGVRVASFKVPTPDELDHDYLWRIYKQTPGRGEIVIFNRSHYEDVLVVRVHKIVPKKVWQKRFDHINNFEKILTDEGTIIFKFFLNISFLEQTERLISRIDTQDKNWKFNPGDIDERNYWAQYMEAYEDVLNLTSTTWAPWYVIPANKKWYRNLLISSILLERLEELNIDYPKSVEALDNYRALLEEQNKSHIASS